MILYTVGHSTRSLEDLLAILRHHGIVTLADVRRFPGSRRHPQFSRERLSTSLQEAGIDYLHLEGLGGRREALADSPNTALRNEAFRGYADHMSTPEFRQGVESLLGVTGPVAIMCAEAVPWRCHRNMISDELMRLGVEVVHLLSINSTQSHRISPHAIDRGDHLEYSSENAQRDLAF